MLRPMEPSEVEAQPEVVEFVAAARAFCVFVETADKDELPHRLAMARRHLLRLYGAGVALPIVTPPTGWEAGPTPSSPLNWSGFDRYDSYWEVFDPYVDELAVSGSLSDDLLDVYGDISRGLALWDMASAPKIAAVWEWRFHFEQHWGDHAIDALRALHRAARAVAVGDGQVP